jgi:hypothetical protein
MIKYCLSKNTEDVEHFRTTLLISIYNEWYAPISTDFILDVYLTLDMYTCTCTLSNRINGVVVSVLTSNVVIMGSSPDRVKPKIIELVFVASPVSTQH